MAYTSDIVTWASSSGDFFSEFTTTAAPKPDKGPIRYGYFVAVGVIIPLGLIFNTLSIIVFGTSKNLRKSTTGLYLVSLAVADDLFLIGEFVRWLDVSSYLSTYNYLAVSDAACQFGYSLRYGAKLSSAWITVAITTERFFIVTFPLKASRVCTRKKALIVICVTYCVCFFLGLFPILTIGIKSYNGVPGCFITNQEGYEIGNWIVLRVGSLLLPGLLVIVLTIMIIICLTKARLKRIRNLSECQSSKRASKALPGVAMEKQLTMMLLAVAITFIILRLPYTILYYINHYKKELWIPLDDFFSHNIYVATKVADLFATVNYAVNFFLYCLSGSIFRKQFRILFGCAEEDSQRKMISMSTLSHHAVNLQHTHLKVNGHQFGKGQSKRTTICHDNDNHTFASSCSVTPEVFRRNEVLVVTPSGTPAITPAVTPGGSSIELDEHEHSREIPTHPIDTDQSWGNKDYSNMAFDNICLDQESRL